MSTIKNQMWIVYAQVMLPTLSIFLAMWLLAGKQIYYVELIIFFVMFSLTLLGVGAGYHRLFSHNSFQVTPAVKYLFGIFGSMAAQGPVIWWAGIHRHHHAFTDRVGDPHSPHLNGEGFLNFLKGLWHAHLGWFVSKDITHHDYIRHVPDLIRDKVVLRVHQLYFFWVILGLVVPGVLAGLILQSWKGFFLGILWGGLFRIALVDHMIWSVNSLCHSFGSRPFFSHDQSTNSKWLAIPTFGESWHNNHHAFSYSARFGFHWWQVDISYYVIKFLSLCGLAWDVKLPTAVGLKSKINQERSQCGS